MIIGLLLLVLGEGGIIIHQHVEYSHKIHAQDKINKYLSDELSDTNYKYMNMILKYCKTKPTPTECKLPKKLKH